MSKIVNIIANTIFEAKHAQMSLNDIKASLIGLDEVEVKIYNKGNQPLPKYAKNGDACMDIYANEIIEDKEYDRIIVKTGLFVELPTDYEMEIRPRSSNTKTEFYIPNSPGTVDAGYRGEIMVCFKRRHISKNNFPYQVGDRIAQLIVRRRERIVWKEVNDIKDLSDSERSTGGFGSTGK